MNRTDLFYEITAHSGQKYIAVFRDGKYHFADGAGWVDANPVPDKIIGSAGPIDLRVPHESA